MAVVEAPRSLHEVDLRHRTAQLLEVLSALHLHEASELLSDLRFVWVRERRWGNTGAAITLVHVAGDVIACREWRGYHQRVVGRRQGCRRCGARLVECTGPSIGPSSVWYTPGEEVRTFGPRIPGLQDDQERPCVEDPEPKRGPRVRLVAYLRVSTARQANDGFGLEAQREAIATWAKKGRHRIIDWCTDAGRSGADDVVDRPGLGAALHRIAAGQAQGLVVARLDRLARDLVIQEQVLAEIRRVGARAHSADVGEDDLLVDEPDDHTRKLVRRVLGAVAEHERDVIRLRMRAGKAAKIEAGGYAHGRPPYGYRAAGRALVEDDDEQLVVEEIRKLRDRGKSYRAICSQLTEQGTIPRGGGAWHPSTVAAIANRRVTRKAVTTPARRNSC